MKLKLILTALVALIVTSAIAVAGSVVITPIAPTTDDALTATVSGSTATYNFYWFKDGVRYSKTTGRQATVPASATQSGELWTAKAYVPSSGYFPETYVGQASVIIAPEAPVETTEACEDGIDNDNDGLVDMQDPGCTDANDNNEYNDPIVEPDSQCEDGLDNDNDGKTDMQDPGCTDANDNDEYNEPIEPSFQCSDGTDNDGDGMVDMNDLGCVAPYDNDEYNAPVETPKACEDGLDNDNDGKTDMQDPGCTNPTDNDEYNPPTQTPQCSDGIDNDNDGKTDMQDPGCTNANDNDETNTNPNHESCPIEKVWINGHLLTEKSLEVELGQTMKIDIELECDDFQGRKELRVVGSIYAGEYEDIQDETGLFIVKPGVTYVKHLTLKMPEIMNTKDNKLRIKVIDNQDAKNYDYKLYIKEKRHNIAIQDIITTEAKAGKPLFIKVRMENLGYKTEDDVRVDASFMGATARTYVDKLKPFEDDEDTETAELMLMVPENAETKDYELKITITYGKQQTAGTKIVKVKGSSIASVVKDGKTLVSITELPEKMTTAVKEEVKIMIVNLNSEARAYKIQAEASWAEVQSEQLVTVGAGEAIETIVTLVPLEKGEQQLSIAITENEKTVKEYAATTNVVHPTRLYAALIGGAAMLVLMVGLIFVIRSVNKRKAEETSFY